MEGMNSCITTDCTLYATGNVSCTMPCEHSAYCNETDYSDWPFDFQKCHYTYAQRYRHTKQISLINRTVAVDYETGLLSEDWRLASVTVNLNTTNTQPSVIINFGIERYSKGYIQQIMVPAVVLVLINIFLLTLNPELPDRMALYVINLFSHFIYVEQLKWQ